MRPKNLVRRCLIGNYKKSVKSKRVIKKTLAEGEAVIFCWQ